MSVAEVAAQKGRLSTLAEGVLAAKVESRAASDEVRVLAARLRVMELRTSHRAAQLRRELRDLEASAWAL